MMKQHLYQNSYQNSPTKRCDNGSAIIMLDGIIEEEKMDDNFYREGENAGDENVLENGENVNYLRGDKLDPNNILHHELCTRFLSKRRHISYQHSHKC